MRALDELYLDHPYYGSRLMTESLKKAGFQVNRKKVSRLMKVMGITAIYPKPKVRTTQPGNIRFPYLLANLKITTQNQVWGTDITYIPVNGGFLYLSVFLDLHARFILGWELSDSLETEFCLHALKKAFEYGTPEIINSDQGVQFTSRAYLELIQSKGIRISMSGRGKCWDNIIVERLWRSIKYEEVYLKQYENEQDAYEGISNYIKIYNEKRLHSSLNHRTPKEVYLGE